MDKQEGKVVISISDFYLKGTLYQPIYDGAPEAGVFSCDKNIRIKKGQILTVNEYFVPLPEHTNNCISLFGGEIVYVAPVPLNKVVLITPTNKEVTNVYTKKIEEQEALERELLTVNDAVEFFEEQLTAEPESIEEIVYAFRQYSAAATEKACIEIRIDIVCTELQQCENLLKRGRMIKCHFRQGHFRRQAVGV